MGLLMIQKLNAREVIEKQAHAEPHAISSYRNNQHFEETIHEAAARIMRWSGLRLQWYVLTIGGVVLIVFTLLKMFEIFIRDEPRIFLSGLGLLASWAVALGWTWLYTLEARGLSDRIITRRLCLRCGKSLLDSPTDEQGSGVCSNCCHVFNLGDYLPPTDSIEALRATRQRMDAAKQSHAAPPIALTRPVPAIRDSSPSTTSPGLSLYEDEYHFNRVMARAAARQIVFKPFALSLRFTLYGILLPTLLFTLLALNFFPLGWPFMTLMIIGCLFFLYLLGMKYLVQLSAMQCRIINHRLCLSCGHTLQDLLLDDRGFGNCPDCGHRFHTLEYKAPGEDERNPIWRDLRQELFLAEENEMSPALYATSATPYFTDQVTMEDPPGSGRRVILLTCTTCGYILEGSPTDEYGGGVCSECGKAFTRQSSTSD